jgi:hypothetical protein
MTFAARSSHRPCQHHHAPNVVQVHPAQCSIRPLLWQWIPETSHNVLGPITFLECRVSPHTMLWYPSGYCAALSSTTQHVFLFLQTPTIPSCQCKLSLDRMLFAVPFWKYHDRVPCRILCPLLCRPRQKRLGQIKCLFSPSLVFFSPRRTH